MIGLDTNVVLRQLTQDDKLQSPIASALFEKINDHYPAYINIVVTLELVWVLKRCYKLDNISVAYCFEQLLSTAGLYLQFSEIIIEVVEMVRLFHNIDFPDVLIAKLNEQMACDLTYTFDKTAANHVGMTLLR